MSPGARPEKGGLACEGLRSPGAAGFIDAQSERSPSVVP